MATNGWIILEDNTESSNPVVLVACLNGATHTEGLDEIFRQLLLVDAIANIGV